MSPAPQCQAVILAGGGGSHLHPLNAAGQPKVLMPVANRALLSFPLRTLEEAGISDVLVVCEGDAAAAAVRSWVAQNRPGSGIEVVRVADGLPSASALRQVLDRVRAEHVVVLSGDVVTEVPLRAQLLDHQLRGAAVTALFGRRRTSAAADTQPGKAPRNVDYVALAPGNRLALFAHSSAESQAAMKEVALPAAALRANPCLSLTTRLTDMQVYVFKTAALSQALADKPELLKVEDHLLPYFAARSGEAKGVSGRGSSGAVPTAASSGSLASTQSGAAVAGGAVAPAEGGAATAGGSGEGSSDASEWIASAYIAPEGAYCSRANRIEGLMDVNRDAVSPELAPRLLREAPSVRGENFLAPGVSLGAKATVGSGCMVGADTVLGDKTSVKRSVIGRGCNAGTAVKVLNSILMDGVRLGDNVHVQNSIVSAGCVLHAGAQVRDCRLGPGAVVAAGDALKGEEVVADGSE